MTRRYGAGTVYQRPDGRWVGQWSAGRDEYGNRVRGTTTPAETEAAAWKALTAARGKPSSTRRRRGGETTGEFLERWLEDIVRRKRRERTYWGYRSIVEHHLAPGLGDVPLHALDRRVVQTWANRQKGAPLTIQHRVDCLRSALTQAVKWNLIETNPAMRLDLEPAQKRVVRALTPDDAQAILDAMEGCWFSPLVTVSLYTGLRQGELLGLRWEDVDLKRDSLTVHKSLARLPGTHGVRFVLTEPKSNLSRRTIPLIGPAADVLRAHQRWQMANGGSWKGLVFARPTRPIDGSALTHEFQAALERAGLPKMRWHDLRHATASLLIAQGVPLAVVSAILGHSGIAITVDTYGHLTEDTKREAMGRLVPHGSKHGSSRAI